MPRKQQPSADYMGAPVRLTKGEDDWGYQVVSDDEPQPGQTVLVETKKGKTFIVEIEEVHSCREWDEDLIWRVRAKDNRDYDGPSFVKTGSTTRTDKDGNEHPVTVWGVRVKGEFSTGDSVEVRRKDDSTDTVFLLDLVRESGDYQTYHFETERQRKIREFNERKAADANASALDY